MNEREFEVLIHKIEGFSGSYISVCVSADAVATFSLCLSEFLCKFNVLTYLFTLVILSLTLSRSKMSYLRMYIKHKMPCSLSGLQTVYGCHAAPSTQCCLITMQELVGASCAIWSCTFLFLFRP